MSWRPETGLYGEHSEDCHTSSSELRQVVILLRSTDFPLPLGSLLGVRDFDWVTIPVMAYGAAK